MLSPDEKKDKIIRATDLDALSSRNSANSKHYFVPSDHYIEDIITSYQNHLQYCEGYSNLSAGRTLRMLFKERKMPIINRGTYLRTKSIDMVINEFVKKFDKCQIVSLGGGSDTRCFSLLNRYENLSYCEIDYPESVKIKKLGILGNNELQKSLGISETTPAISSKTDFMNFDSDLITSRYKLIGYDLRNVDVEFLNLKNFDNSLPTLILSECVLCYLSPEENETIIKFWSQWCSGYSAILIYEPMSLNDPFGLTMARNLSQRGLNLQSFSKYPNLQSRFEFLKNNCHLKNTRLTEMCLVGGYSSEIVKKPWIDQLEEQRINRLELIDEVEEIKLLYKHYCLCFGDNSDSHVFDAIDNWTWTLSD
jgi:[phosphatase 2A protein]-leucine-carboxy methyltransferase